MANVAPAAALHECGQFDFDPKFHLQGVVPTNRFSCRKTRINVLS